MCTLRIEDLHIINYRGFSEKIVKLNPRMNVFAGENGSGKTTVLEAACVSLGAYLASFKKYVPSRYIFNVSKNDVHLRTNGISQYPCKIECSAIWGADEKLIRFQRILEKANGRTKFECANPMQETVVSWEKEIEKAEHADKGLIFPIVLYLSSERLSGGNKSLPRSGITFNRTDAYNECLNRRHCIELALKYIQMLQAVAVEENGGKHFPAYEAILDAVNTAIKEGLSLNESVIFSTKYSKDIVALRTKEGTIIPYASLSDGYRSVIKIILDVATRMCMLNPYLKGDALKETPGVVVIDEIELSLHPTWQKRISSILKILFPKVQFICATHSPFIIQSLGDGELHILDNEL